MALCRAECTRRRICDDRRCQLLRASGACTGVNDLVDQPPLQRFLGLDPPGAQHKMQSLTGADHMLKKCQPGVRNDPAGHLGKREPGVGLGDNQIAGKRQLKASSHRRPLNGRDDDPVLFNQTLEKHGGVGPRISLLHPAVTQVVDIGSRAKRRVAGGNDQCSGT
ncbi:hypothetical protein D9M68_748580 [compost metagenome]